MFLFGPDTSSLPVRYLQRPRGQRSKQLPSESSSSVTLRESSVEGETLQKRRTRLNGITGILLLSPRPYLPCYGSQLKLCIPAPPMVVAFLHISGNTKLKHSFLLCLAFKKQIINYDRSAHKTRAGSGCRLSSHHVGLFISPSPCNQ